MGNWCRGSRGAVGGKTGEGVRGEENWCRGSGGAVGERTGAGVVGELQEGELVSAGQSRRQVGGVEGTAGGKSHYCCSLSRPAAAIAVACGRLDRTAPSPENVPAQRSARY